MISESCIVSYSNLCIYKYTLVGCTNTVFQSKTFNLVSEWVQSCTTVLPLVIVPLLKQYCQKPLLPLLKPYFFSATLGLVHLIKCNLTQVVVSHPNSGPCVLMLRYCNLFCHAYASHVPVCCR